MDRARLTALLEPWLGEAAPSFPLPLVIEVTVRPDHIHSPPAALGARLAAAAPEARVETHGVWVGRLIAFARSLQAVALATLALVAGIAAAVVAVAVRAGIAARRQAIGVLHDLGATDGDIAGRFAVRAAWLTGLGAVGGALAALPVLGLLSALGAPLLGYGSEPVAAAGADGIAAAAETLLAGLDALSWPPLIMLPAVAALLAWAVAQATVRLWLRRLP
jgi:cell division transport system permease protein